MQGLLLACSQPPPWISAKWYETADLTRLRIYQTGSAGEGHNGKDSVTATILIATSHAGKKGDRFGGTLSHYRPAMPFGNENHCFGGSSQFIIVAN